MTGFESVVEQAAIDWLEELGWRYLPGPMLAPDGMEPERTSYRTVILEGRLRAALARIECFGPWRTVDGEALAPDATPQIQVLLAGLFEKRRFLDYLYHFVLWETDDAPSKGSWIKKIAGYHQYHAVNKAVAATLRVSAESGDQRIGVVWHTQGSGKSVSMTWYAGKVILEPQMQNPTLVVVTDRNDLDGQLYAQFCAAKDLVPDPRQTASREHLRELLDTASGGLVFTTIQKFSLTEQERALRNPFPVLSQRRNIVVVVDEAHRTQYGFETRLAPRTGQVSHGLAQNLRDALPGASFIGFTGTPIEFDDRSTPAVFGDYIDTYTIRQAVEEGATVPILLRSSPRPHPPPRRGEAVHRRAFR